MEICARSLTDRATASGAVGVGSIPAGRARLRSKICVLELRLASLEVKRGNTMIQRTKKLVVRRSSNTKVFERSLKQ